MKRLYIGITVLAILLAAGLTVAFCTHRVYTPIVTLLEEAAEGALKEALPTAAQKAREAKRLWDKQKYLTALVADHTPMEDIDRLFREMEIYASTGETPHFAACCAQLASMVENMADAHTPNLHNLL